MFFSIIIPVYNVEKYLDQCMESVIRQEFKDYEVILIDDGATDSSGKMCDVWERKLKSRDTDCCIKVIHQENQGLDGARNSGLNVASGEWIVFLDSDDELRDGMLQTLFERIQKYPADLYCYNMVKMHEDGTEYEKGVYHSEYETITFFDERDRLNYYVKRLILYKDSWEVIFRCYNKRIIDEHNLRFQKCSEVFAEDLAFTLQYILWVNKIQMLCDILYCYRQVPKSIMHTLDQRTILPRLFNLIEAFYEQVDQSGKKFIKSNFEQINLGILDFHISHKLDQMSTEEIRQEIDKVKKRKTFKNWLKKASKKAYNNPDIFMLRPWL